MDRITQLAVGYKFRPCIIISDSLSDINYPPPNYQGFVVSPLYSIHGPSGKHKSQITYDMVLKAQAYQRNNIFYLPESKEFNIEEAFVRLDRLQFAKIDYLKPMPIMLSEKAFDSDSGFIMVVLFLVLLLKDFKNKSKKGIR